MDFLSMVRQSVPPAQAPQAVAPAPEPQKQETPKTPEPQPKLEPQQEKPAEDKQSQPQPPAQDPQPQEEPQSKQQSTGEPEPQPEPEPAKKAPKKAKKKKAKKAEAEPGPEPAPEPEPEPTAVPLSEDEIEETIYQGHSELVDVEALASLKVLMVGAGSIGSFAAVAMMKMGIQRCRIYDFDNIELHNQANQIYNWRQAGKPKLDALMEYLQPYTEEVWEAGWEFVSGHLKPDNIAALDEYAPDVIICAVDNMEARKLLFEYAEKAAGCKLFIDARIGQVLAECYAVQAFMPDEADLFKKSDLDSDEDLEPLKCTEKSIIFPVMFTSSWITSCLYHLVRGTISNMPINLDANFGTMKFFQTKRPS